MINNREKVIKVINKLDDVLDDVAMACAKYVKTIQTLNSAIILLKKQEPQIMTMEEVKQHDNQDGCVWFERPTYNAVAAFVRQDEEFTEIISPYLLGMPINHVYVSNTSYGETWRCWTSHPTPEQMRDTLWEENDGNVDI